MNNGCCQIRFIVDLGQKLSRWRKKASEAAGQVLPSDVPAGHIAVTVGISCKRFVVPMTYLNHPLFRKLLLRVEEVYGFTNSGPLAIPCAEEVFEDLLQWLAQTETESRIYNCTCTRPVRSDEFQICCHMGSRRNVDLCADSRPLLQ